MVPRYVLAGSFPMGFERLRKDKRYARLTIRVDLNATALPALQRVEMKDLERFKWTESGSGH